MAAGLAHALVGRLESECMTRRVNVAQYTEPPDARYCAWRVRDEWGLSFQCGTAQATFCILS